MSLSKTGKFEWLSKTNLGVFFHWGIYSQLGRGEWVRFQERIPFEEYRKLAATFRPKKGWADDWMKLVKRSEATFPVLTTKHHDGYCLFDTATTNDFSAPTTGPKRDLVAEYVEACRRHKLKVGFYYSAPDWRFGWKMDLAPGDIPEYNEYKDTILTQIEELCTHYGPIDYWWWDGGPPELEKTIARMRRWQPGLIINDRCGMKVDIGSSEKELKFSDDPDHYWEVSMTSCKHWGFYDDEATCQWMSLSESLHWLICCVARRAVFLYNIGPKSSGAIPLKARRLFEGMGEWIRSNRASLQEVGPSSMMGGCGGVVVAKGTTAYLHILHWASPYYVVVTPEARIFSAKILATGQKLQIERDGDRTILHGLPKRAPDGIDTVVVLTTDRSTQME